MPGRKCVGLLVHVIYYLVDTNAMKIQLNHSGIGVLGGNESELICSFLADTTEDIISLQILTTFATSTFEPIALFRPNGDANLTYMGSYLHGRVELTNSIILVRQITLRFTYLICADQKEYRCRMTYFVSAEELFMETEEKNITVKVAPPLSPDRVSLLNSQKRVEEGTNVTFICDGNVGKPPGTYIWQMIMKNNASITFNTVTTITTESPESCSYNGTSFLTIEMSFEHYQAIIRCAEQSMTTLYKDSEPVNMLYKVRKPTVLKYPDQDFYLVGSNNITLTCSADGNPKSGYAWYNDEKMSHVLSSNASLVIDSNASNSGTYFCHAFNSLSTNTYNQYQSVDISIVYNIPITATKTTEQAFCEQSWLWIVVVLIVVLALANTIISVLVVRSCVAKVKQSLAYCDLQKATLENNRYDTITHQNTSINDGYEDVRSHNPIQSRGNIIIQDDVAKRATLGLPVETVKQSSANCDLQKTTLENNRYDTITHQNTSINDEYEDVRSHNPIQSRGNIIIQDKVVKRAKLGLLEESHKMTEKSDDKKFVSSIKDKNVNNPHRNIAETSFREFKPIGNISEPDCLEK